MSRNPLDVYVILVVKPVGCWYVCDNRLFMVLHRCDGFDCGLRMRCY